MGDILCGTTNTQNPVHDVSRALNSLRNQFPRTVGLMLTRPTVKPQVLHGSRPKTIRRTAKESAYLGSMTIEGEHGDCKPRESNKSNNGLAPFEVVNDVVLPAFLPRIPRHQTSKMKSNELDRFVIGAGRLQPWAEVRWLPRFLGSQDPPLSLTVPGE